MKKVAVAVIGAGASGFMAAISAAQVLAKEKGPHGVLLLEAGKKPGRKLLATGNGRCNLTNQQAGNLLHYHGDRNQAEKVLQACPPAVLRRRFQEMGLWTREESEGRVYPRGEQAAAVVQLFLMQCRRWQVEIWCESSVESLHKKGHDWVLTCKGKEPIIASRVILACGSPAAPHLGGSTAGLSLLQTAGIDIKGQVQPFRPGLVPIRVSGQRMSALKGMRCKGDVRLLADGEVIAQESGEIQFTEEALSGICLFQLSHLVSEWEVTGTVNGKRKRELTVSVDLLPDMKEEMVLSYLMRRCRTYPKEPAEELLSGVMNVRVGQEVVRSVLGKEAVQPVGSRKIPLPDIASRCKRFYFTVEGAASWKQAQVACGGLRLTQAHIPSMELKQAPGLHATGEIWNINGDCGGFNLHWAFATGWLAGEAAANSLCHDRKRDRKK